MQEFFRRLREKHLVRTAVVYLGGAWLMLEVTGFFVDTYGLSRKLVDVAVLLVVLGFPAALIIAWYHGEKGRQQVAGTEVSLLLTLAVLAGIGTYRVSTGDEVSPAGRPQAGAPVADSATEDLGETSVAVLPFVNSTGVDSLDWLGPGVSDMLTSSLARAGGLRVVSPQRLFDLLHEAGHEETDHIPEDLAMRVAASSGARRMVRGSVLGTPGDLAVDAQLIDLRDGTVVAAERVRGKDVFALSDSVADRLAARIGKGGREETLASGGRAVGFGEGPPVPPIALVGDMEKLKSFQGDVRTLWEHPGPDSIGARYRLADLLEEMPGRESEVRKALTEIVRLDSSQARAVFRLARLAARQGNEEAADSLVSTYVKVEKDPVKAAMGAGRVYERMGRTEKARETYRGLLRAHPEARQALDRLVATWLRAGDPEGARRELDRWSGDETSPLAVEARLLAGDTWAWTGDLDRALSTWREAEMVAGRQGLSDVRASALESALSVDWVRDTTRGRSPVNPTIWTLIDLGRGEQARNLVEASRRLEVGEADRIDPITYHTLLYAWARSMELLGQEQAAASAYRELLDDWGDVVGSLPRFADAPARLHALRT